MLIKEEAIILFGPTQYGKSSFINSLLLPANAAHSAPVGGAVSGTSVTKTCESFVTRIGLVQDNAGYNDTTSTITPMEIANQVKRELMTHGIAYARFLVFESFSESSVQLRNTIKKLTDAFGNDAKRSVIVLVTKQDKVDEEEYSERWTTIQDFMHTLEIGDNLVPWRNKKYRNETNEDFQRELDSQLTVLQNVIRNHKHVTSVDKPDFCVGDHVYQQWTEPRMISALERTECRHGIAIDAQFNGINRNWELRIALVATTSSRRFVYEDTVSSCADEGPEKNNWHKVMYPSNAPPQGNGDRDNSMMQGSTDDMKSAAEERNTISSSARPSDSPDKVLARVNFLKEFPELIPNSSRLEVDGESFAVWCKTGKWESLPGPHMKKNLSMAAASVYTAVAFAEVPGVALVGLATAASVGLHALHEHMSRKNFEETVSLLTAKFEEAHINSESNDQFEHLY